MNRLQKYLSLGVVVLVVALLCMQYIGWQKQITRHANAINFWKVEVPKVQKKYPNFKPQNSQQMIAKENQQYADQKKSVYVNSGIILGGGVAAELGVLFLVPPIARRYYEWKELHKNKQKKKK